MEWTGSIGLVSLILVGVLILLTTEKVSVDRTAIGILVVLSVSGILTPAEAVAGFANPAVITVAAMFLISRGMIRTGAVDIVAERVLHLSRGNRGAAVVIIIVVVAAASAFINNTPVVVLFIPIVLGLSCQFEMSPSKLLIPISYASILAGTCTLIGTSTNIIVSDLSQMYGHGTLGMFELASLGIPIAAMGLVLLSLLAPRLLPERTAPLCELEDREDKRYLAELEVTEGGWLAGQEPTSAIAEKHPTLTPIEVIRHSRIFDPFRERVTLTAGDTLLVKGSADDLVAILQTKAVQLPHAEEGLDFKAGTDADIVVELIVPPLSSLLHKRLLSTDLQGAPDIHIIAVKSRRLHYAEQKIQNIRLRVGDILLVRCTREKLDRLRAGGDVIIVEDVHHAIVDKSKAMRALAIFSGVILAATTGLADIMVCAITGVLLMALFRCFVLRDAYRFLEPEILLLIVGTIALGKAMEETGASRLYADGFLRMFEGYGPGVVLAGFVLLTSISTQILSNNATAVLLLPIAISTAQSLGVDAKPFIIGVCFGASACFATPIGYQTNLLVYGPGGYRFSDYLKLGIPLNILVIAMASVFIPMIWAF